MWYLQQALNRSYKLNVTLSSMHVQDSAQYENYIYFNFLYCTQIMINDLSIFLPNFFKGRNVMHRLKVYLQPKGLGVFFSYF
jgi:hypothetical protein